MSIVNPPLYCQELDRGIKDVLEGRNSGDDFLRRLNDILDTFFKKDKGALIFLLEPESVNAITVFLSPMNRFFQLILKRANKHSLNFDVQKLPKYARTLLLRTDKMELLPPIFRKKIPTEASRVIEVPLFEAYFFYFAYSAVTYSPKKPSLQYESKEPSWTIVTPIKSLFSPKEKRPVGVRKTVTSTSDAYLTLLSEYLNVFWPLEIDYRTRSLNMSPYPDTFLEIVIQFWLCQSGFINQKEELVYLAPTTKLVEAVILLLNHFFRGSPEYNPKKFHNFPNVAPHKFKRELMSIRGPLYEFLYINLLKSIQSRKPDIPYHEIVDLWLLYLNPWKYCPSPTKRPTGPSSEALSEKFVKHLGSTSFFSPHPTLSEPEEESDTTWLKAGPVRSHVFSNLAFYVILMNFFLQAAVNHSETASDLLMIYNVLTTYADLFEHICAAEKAMASKAGRDYEAILKDFAVLEKLDPADSSFKFIPLFTSISSSNDHDSASSMLYFSSPPQPNQVLADRLVSILKSLPPNVTYSSEVNPAHLVELLGQLFSINVTIIPPKNKPEEIVTISRTERRKRMVHPDGTLTKEGEDAVRKGWFICPKTDVIDDTSGPSRLDNLAIALAGYISRLTGNPSDLKACRDILYSLVVFLLVVAFLFFLNKFTTVHHNIRINIY